MRQLRASDVADDADMRIGRFVGMILDHRLQEGLPVPRIANHRAECVRVASHVFQDAAKLAFANQQPFVP